MQRILDEIHARHADDDGGALADYIPELTTADPATFGITLVTADGHAYTAGDVDVPFTIQSVSKAFVYGMALDERGPETVAGHVDVEPSGEAFNEISLDAETGRPRNPMINAGAIVMTGLLADRPDDRRFDRLLGTFSRLAADELGVDDAVYRSESATGFRNRAIAHLLRGNELLTDPVDDVVEDYFRQCSVLVTCTQLATMAATLAHGGVNPVTDERVLSAKSVEQVLSVMSSCGMYDYSGTWMARVGLPAKSGVGGGVVGVLPGQFGFAVHSPLLDAKGNSVRGVAAFEDLSSALDLHLLRAPAAAGHAVRRTYALADVPTARRQAVDHDVLAEAGRGVLVHELQGDLFAAPLEQLVRLVADRSPEVHTVVLDLARAGATDGATTDLLTALHGDLAEEGGRLLVADPKGVLPPTLRARLGGTDALDDVLQRCEEELLGAAGRPHGAAARIHLEDLELVRGLSPTQLVRVAGATRPVHAGAGTVLLEQGDVADAVWVLLSGTVRIRWADEGGDETRIADLYPGVVFGEGAVIADDARVRSASVVATSDVQCLVLDRDALHGLLEEDPVVYAHLLRRLLESVSARLARANRESAAMRG